MRRLHSRSTAPTLTLNVSSETYIRLASPIAFRSCNSGDDVLSYHGILSNATFGDGSEVGFSYTGDSTATETLTITTRGRDVSMDLEHPRNSTAFASP